MEAGWRFANLSADAKISSTAARTSARPRRKYLSRRICRCKGWAGKEISCATSSAPECFVWFDSEYSSNYWVDLVWPAPKGPKTTTATEAMSMICTISKVPYRETRESNGES